MKTKSSYSSIFARWLKCFGVLDGKRVEAEDLAKDLEVGRDGLVEVEPEEAPRASSFSTASRLKSISPLSC